MFNIGTYDLFICMTNLRFVGLVQLTLSALYICLFNLDMDYSDVWTFNPFHKGSKFAGNFVGKRDKRAQ
jgi:hypothetical protein